MCSPLINTPVPLSWFSDFKTPSSEISVSQFYPSSHPHTLHPPLLKMSYILRRSLASLAINSPGPSNPSIHMASASSTLPTDVRRRRAVQPAHPTSSPSPLSDPAFLGKTPKKLPAKLEADFQALRASNQFKGDELSARRAFLKSQVAWRSRVRGTSEKKGAHHAKSGDREGEVEAEGVDGEGETSKAEIVAQRIYLPNIQIRLMRNHTPPGEAYDPNIATFRIPPSMTKTDLRSYLSAVYNLPTTFIRTDNYLAPLARPNPKGEIRRIGGSAKNYKRAVVGLVEPFHYPDDVEELRAGEDGERLAKVRSDWLEYNFRTEEDEEMRKRARMKMYKGWRWRGKTHDNAVSFSYLFWPHVCCWHGRESNAGKGFAYAIQGNTIREIMKRRGEREASIAAEAARMHAEGGASAQVPTA
jgi:large subunit ribosomal protein L23